MAGNLGAEAFEFGPYRIDLTERLLRRGSELIPLPPKAVETLLVLVENTGRMVEKTELIQAVWPDTFVEEGALTRNVSLLRKALGDAGEESSTYIETIPKRGYQFVAPVKRSSQGAAPGQSVIPVLTEAPGDAIQARPALETKSATNASASWMWIAPAVILCMVVIAAGMTYARRSRAPGIIATAPLAAHALAVLPFRNVDGETAEDYFADGMTQAMITGLSKLGNLRVINLSAEPGGKTDQAAIDRTLRNAEVQRVLTGTVLRSGARVRIDAQLLDPSTRAVYWANSYERDLKDVLSLESDVARAIAMEIQVSTTADDQQGPQAARQINTETLDAYLRGRYYWNRRTEESVKRAAQYFQKAIESDPAYAPAYSGLADSYALLGSVGIDGMPPKTAMPMAKAAAMKAIELDPNFADGHTSLAYVHLSYDWDLNAARDEFERALALNPSSSNAHHWYSHYYMAAGDLPKATTEMQAALRMEPLSPSINIGIGWCYYYTQQYAKAIEQYRSVVETDPSLPLAHQTLGMALLQNKMYDEAIGEFQKAVMLSGGSPFTLEGLATAYAAAGKTTEAGAEMAKIEELSKHRYVPAIYLANIHNSLGDSADTLRFAWKALGERSDYFMYLRVEPLVGKMAGNPEFLKILASIHH
ncbi:MAG: tetratricopeptide repeat protein [Bryobacteraceae bacterium]